jgi:hypothetical protein
MNYLKKAQDLFSEPGPEDVYEKSRGEEEREVLRMMLTQECQDDPESMAYYIVDNAPPDFIDEMLNDLLELHEDLLM